MIDNLEDAINHARKKAQELRSRFEDLYRKEETTEEERKEAVSCLDCSKEHAQLVAWLTELQERREADRWIPVSERLPEKEGWYLVDRKERTSSIQYFFFSTVNHKPYWSGECKVYYWRPLPEPYKESEDA